MGVALAMISMLTLLPALLAIFGRRAFWSPASTRSRTSARQGTDETHGFWRRVGDRVARAPARGSGSAATSCCSCSPLGVLNFNTT